MFRSTAVAIAAFAALAVAPARAADMPRLPQMVPLADDTVEEFATGWYLRGDIGFSATRLGDVSSLIGPAPSSNTLDNAGVFGVGAGLKAGWFRMDVTGDYMSVARYRGTQVTSNDTSASIDAAIALANGYFDLGTWYGFTPYVGAGVGASYLRTDVFVSPTLPAGSQAAATAKWNLAWALMAGASYRISARMSVDAGYRYLSMGDAVSGYTVTGNQFTLGSISAHEVRVGLRYLID